LVQDSRHFFGENYAKQDIKKALELASVCEHPSAVWLTKLFAGRDITSRKQARRVFVGCESDPRALCFAGVLEGNEDEIRRAADLGDALAQAFMTRQTDDEVFSVGGKICCSGERDGLYHLGCCYQRGRVCVKDAERAKENFLGAVELGCVYAMVCLGRLLEDQIQNDLFGSEELLQVGTLSSS
jgi:hypothetical protein